MEVSFIQEQSDPRSQAYETLKRNGHKSKSLRLMAIASSIKAGGHFDAVTGEIDKMMEVIKQEERDDIRKKDWCKEEIHKNEQEAARYEYKVEKTLVATTEEIIQTKKDLKEMEETRKEEHAVYQ